MTVDKRQRARDLSWTTCSSPSSASGSPAPELSASLETYMLTQLEMKMKHTVIKSVFGTVSNVAPYV